MSELITEDTLCGAFDLFDELTSDMVVVRTKSEVMPCGADPFDHHFHCSFIIQDNNTDADVYHEFLEPLMREMAKHMRHIKKLATQGLPLLAGLGVRSFNFRYTRRIPFRCTLVYDIVQQGTVVTLDFLGRHVGNYHRTIINGPLHRHQMPFREDPEDGREFEYLYVPLERKSYGDWIYDEEGEDEVFARLPGLEQCVTDESLHRYRVRGDYCYYMGETLEREST